ncbi:MAG: metallophosphoesterase [Anaerolineae bacterium]|nr:metallophosphoesterase [Anaerolineae bacterium]
MRLAVLSDIHGNLTAFETAWADVQSQGEFDQIWILGDLAAFGPRPAACIQRVRELQEQIGKEKFKVIGGNTDRYLVNGTRPRTPSAQDEETFKNLAARWQGRDTALNWTVEQISYADYEFLKQIRGAEVQLHAEGYGPVIGYHGIPGNDESNALKPDTTDEEARDALLDREGRMGIGGHTHLHMDRDLGSWRAINVGSVGWSFGAPRMAEWGLFTFEKGEAAVDLRPLPYDVQAVLADFESVQHPAPDVFIRAGKLRG